jgi:hypothetical protein
VGSMRIYEVGTTLTLHEEELRSAVAIDLLSTSKKYEISRNLSS